MRELKHSSIHTNWKLYCFVFVFSITVHYVFMNFLSNLQNFDGFGIQITYDFVHIYEPCAKKIVQWFEGTGDWPHLSGLALFHITYSLLTGVIYILFGVENRLALINFQILITSILFVLILHISIKSYYSKAVAVLFTCMSIVFFNSMMWVLWASPESFYRALFIGSFFVLLELYFNKKRIAFFVVVFISFVVLTFTRPDTIILFLPIYMLCVAIIIDAMKTNKMIPAIIMVFMIVVIIGFRNEFAEMLKRLLGIVSFFYKEGYVLICPPSVAIKPIVVPFDPSQEGNIIYYVFRALKLFFLRVYYFVDIYPLWWTKGHRLYYALYMFPVYILTVVGLTRAKQTKDRYFIMYFLVYVSSMILHGLTRVDSPLRNTLTSTTCLIMFAGYGFDYLYEKYRKYFPLPRFLREMCSDSEDDTKGDSVAHVHTQRQSIEPDVE